MQTCIVVFTGIPGTGKTTLSRQVAHSLNLPLFAKDDIKEIMFDNIGWSDAAFSAKLAHATFGIMDYITEQHLKNDSSIALEGNYIPALASEKFRKWQKTYSCRVIQIVCQAGAQILAQRFYDRQHRDRHPGHNNIGTVEEYVREFRTRITNKEDQPLDVDGPIRFVNTNDFNMVSVPDITLWVRTNISNS